MGFMRVVVVIKLSPWDDGRCFHRSKLALALSVINATEPLSAEI